MEPWNPEERRNGNVPQNKPSKSTVGYSPALTLSAVEGLRFLQGFFYQHHVQVTQKMLLPSVYSVFCHQNVIGTKSSEYSIVRSTVKKHPGKNNSLFFFFLLKHMVCEQGKPTNYHILHTYISDDWDFSTKLCFYYLAIY